MPAASSTFATALRVVPVLKGSFGLTFTLLKRPPMNRSAPSESRASPLITRLVLGFHAEDVAVGDVERSAVEADLLKTGATGSCARSNSPPTYSVGADQHKRVDPEPVERA